MAVGHVVLVTFIVCRCKRDECAKQSLALYSQSLFLLYCSPPHLWLFSNLYPLSFSLCLAVFPPHTFHFHLHACNPHIFLCGWWPQQALTNVSSATSSSLQPLMMRKPLLRHWCRVCRQSNWLKHRLIWVADPQDLLRTDRLSFSKALHKDCLWLVIFFFMYILFEKTVVIYLLCFEVIYIGIKKNGKEIPPCFELVSIWGHCLSVLMSSPQPKSHTWTRVRRGIQWHLSRFNIWPQKITGL